MAVYSKNGELIHSNILIHPGEILKDELEARNIKQKEFAADIGLPATQLNEIINGKRIVSSELAIILETALGINASFWVNLQADYELAKARQSEKVTERSENVQAWALIKNFVNINYLRKVSEIGENIDANIEKIKSIFNLSSIEELELIDKRLDYEYFRKSPSLSTNRLNLGTWVNYVKYLANKETASGFNPEAMPQLIEDLKKVFLNSEVVKNTKETLYKYGIILIIQEKLEGVNVDGIAFWNESNPVIVLTVRHKRLDNFVYTLMHELGHVSLHIRRDGKFIWDDFDDTSSVNNPIEQEADIFASNNLINPQSWTDFVRKVHNFDDETIVKFAGRFGVPPSVVRGRLCKENFISFKKKTDINNEIS